MRQNLIKRTLLPMVILFLFSAPFAEAQVVHSDYQGTWKGKVLEVTESEERTIPGTEIVQEYQTIKAEVLNGPIEGREIVIENDYFNLDAGDKFYFNYNVHIDGVESYGVVNIDRTTPLFVLMALFVGVVILFGGFQGVRSLCALLGSFFAIFYVLLPGILSGSNPILLSVMVASGILFAAIFFTHGFNRESLVAYGGTMIAVILTSIFALFAVYSADLTGFASDASTYLNFNTGGTLDFTALLLGAIIIGVLGVLDDISVTQAAVVTELYRSNPSLSKREVYVRALRVGREHVGALVNTLILAYTGAALPLLLHASITASSVVSAINTELFATEIVRMIVGSVGLILAVPIVTLLAAVYLKGYTPKHPHSYVHH